MNVDAIFRSIGRFCVRFRWLMTLVWIVGAVAAVTYLPSLSSVTQNDNTKFLPASAPVEKATKLAAPFGTSDLVPVPVVAVRTTGPLTAADTAAMAKVQANLKTVPNVKKILDLGTTPTSASKPGQAQQLLVLVSQLSNNQNAAVDLIDAMRAKISQAHRAGRTRRARDRQHRHSG